MPIVSGFVVPKMNPTSHVGKIRVLRPVVMAIEWQEDGQAENDDTKDVEIPEEILHIMSYITNLGTAKHSIVLSSPKLYNAERNSLVE